MFSLKKESVQSALTAAGYDDVQFDDVALARRSDGGEWEVVLDHGGMLKLTVTHAERAADGDTKRVDVLGRKASLLTERTRMTTALLKLEDASELAAALKALEALLATR
jgi:hypothetical protein